MDDDDPNGAAEEGGGRRRRARGPMVTSEAFEQLATEWAALHASIPGATPFTHPAWHATWLRHFGSASLPVFLSIRLDDELVGVAALDMGRDEATTLGDHHVQDYAGPLVKPDAEAAAAVGLLEWLAEDLTPALDLWGLPAGSPIVEAFAGAAAGMGWSFSSEAEANCPRLALPGDFETYIASLTKHDRHEVRRKLRNLAAAGAVSFESATSPEDVDAAMDRFLELMRISRGDKDAFLTPVMEAFFRDLAATFARLGMLRLSTLALDGVAVAMLLVFENSGATFLYNSGFDPAFSHLAVGLLSKVLAIRDAIERGQAEFDFLRGDEAYKRDLGGLPLPLVTVHLRQV
ncbi:MAG: hypothetical protein C0506_12545 [Anaerolinea sp.]|nr:hypothetical protein [Anaerolinea sp.]